MSPIADDLHRGIGMGLEQAPTLKSVRRMENLTAAFREISRKAIGCDGFPYKAYLEPLKYAQLNPNFLLEYPNAQPLKTIQESLLFNANPDAVLTRTVRGGRKIQVGTVRNRIVERAFARKLAQHFDKYFAASSLAFRPGKRPEQIASRIRSLVRQGAHWCLKTDVEKFFPSINRDVLFEQVEDSISDKELITFIFEAISPFQLDEGRFITTGLPTGNGLSPALSNLHLHRFDLACSEFLYFRYADDLLVLGKTRETVEGAKKQLEFLLGVLGLRLNQEKTQISDLYRESVVFLGYEIRGGNLYCSSKSIESLEQRLRFWGRQVWRKPKVVHTSKVNIMKGFVRKFRVGSVRKLFRVVDRRLQSTYPVGLTLTGLLDATHRREHRSKDATKCILARPMGIAARLTNRESPIGQAPTVAAAGEWRLE